MLVGRRIHQLILGTALTTFIILSNVSAHASTDPWVWQNPLPQGDTLRGIACPSATLCKAVGEGGTILSWNGSSWTEDASPTGHGLMGVACASTTACKAVGGGGTVVSWDGTSWALDTSATGNLLRAVSCSSATQCKAVGDGGAVVSWDGSQWTADDSGTTEVLKGVSCPSATLCKAVGHATATDSGFALTWDGASWSDDGVPALTKQLYAVSCGATDSCKAVGLFGEIVSWDGSSWSQDTNNSGSSTLQSVSCSSAAQCKAGADTGLLISWNGSAWGSDSYSAGNNMYGTACRSGSSCKAVGGYGRIASWDGVTWNNEAPARIGLSQVGLGAIDCPSPLQCKAIGGFGVVASWNGTAWSTESSPSGLFTGIDCPSSSSCKAVGFAGQINSWNGSTWTAETSGITANLNAISCPSPTLCKAVGDSGQILSWNGSSWSADAYAGSVIPSDRTKYLYGVSCPSTTLCKAVGRDGILFSWNGSVWSLDAVGTTPTHRAVSCPSTTSCKAVGDSGVIRSWSGSTWTIDSSPTSGTLYAVSCSSPNRCKAVGDGGVVISWDGSSWTTDSSPTANALAGVACATSSQQCISVGSATTIIATDLEAPPATATPTITNTQPVPTATPAPSQQGALVVVNSAADTDDGSCDLLGVGPGNQDCTLREAIHALAATSIVFNIPAGPGCTSANVCTIQLGSMLALNTRSFTIDGAAYDGKITIDGGNGMAGGVRIFEGYGDSYVTLNGLNLVDANGGAVFTSFVNLTVTNCTFANNYLNGGGAAIRAENRPITISNSTFYNNTGTSAGAISHGGASFAPLTITNSTFYNNVATFGAGYASAIHTGRPVTLYNTLLASVAGSFNVNCRTQSGGSISADGYNYANDSSCGGATATNVNLDALADNGGPTLTMAPSSGSIAIDGGNDGVCNAAPVNNLDQRGYLRPAGAHCDSGAFESSSLQAATYTPTLTPTDTPTVMPTDTGTPTPTATATATSTATVPSHDSVVLPVNPLTVKIPSGATVVRKTLKVKVQNADLLPVPEGEGHTIQLTVDDSDCPAGTVVGAPDFDKDADGDQDSVLLAGGDSARAILTLDVAAASFATFNHKAPARCSLYLIAQSPGFEDPNAGNNIAPLEINVIDANDGEQTSVHESFVTSLKPLKLTIRAGSAAATKAAKVKVGNADLLPEPENPGDLLTVIEANGSCPTGTVGSPDYDGQSSVTVNGGKAASGKLPVTAAATELHARNAKSPARCLATVTVAGPGGDTDASNDTSTLVIDVYDKNDLP